MILIFEMIWLGTAHTVANSGAIQVIARGFPEQQIRVYAHRSHLAELRSDPGLRQHANVQFHAIPVSGQFQYRPQIVSIRRGLRELWTLLSALRSAPVGEPCLIVLLSATPTAIFAGRILSRLMRRSVRIQVGLHGNLNDAFAWRSRNPLVRAIDLYAALTRRPDGRVRFLVLEDQIRSALIRRLPVAEASTDVLPHPTSEAEAEQARPMALTAPVRIGLVGQATEDKGLSSFLALAGHFRQCLPDAVSFRLVGHLAPGVDAATLAVLHDPPPVEWPTRPEFIERLAALHYICLPLRPAYYNLAASGALIDAINWLKPIIATPVPIVVDLFSRFGDIGFLCDDLEEMRAVIDRLARTPDQARYDRQVANLRRIRAARLPQALAPNYRSMTERCFPDLLTDHHQALPVEAR